MSIIDIYGVSSINEDIIINFINYMAILIPEDTNTILLFVKTINDVLKNIPRENKKAYMYINTVMIEFRNGVRNPNVSLGKCFDSFFRGLQFCNSNNISYVILTLLEDMTRSITFYELVDNGISNDKMSELLFNSKNINKSYEMMYSQPSRLNMPLYIQTQNPNIIKRLEINSRYMVINEIYIPTASYMAEFVPTYTNMVTNMHNILSKHKKCKCVNNLQNVGGLLFQMINNILRGILYNKSHQDIIKDNALLFNRSRISKCKNCNANNVLYNALYMIVYLKYELPTNNNHYDTYVDAGNNIISKISNTVDRVFKYNLKGGYSTFIREGFHIPNTRTVIQHNGFLKLFTANNNHLTIPEIEKKLNRIYQLTPNTENVPLYCALVKICIVIKHIIPFCLKICNEE